jgi:4-hydroxy-3-polyprenylbenzoate decarboxylase
VAANHPPDVAVQVREALIARRSQVPKAIVVDEDVDVFNVGQVIHAFSTKCHPVRGITARAHESAIDLTPFLSPEERYRLHGATAVFDCTWPVDWSVDFDRCLRVSFNEVYPQDIKEKVLDNWKNYGFK